MLTDDMVPLKGALAAGVVAADAQWDSRRELQLARVLIAPGQLAVDVEIRLTVAVAGLHVVLRPACQSLIRTLMSASCPLSGVTMKRRNSPFFTSSMRFDQSRPPRSSSSALSL